MNVPNFYHLTLGGDLLSLTAQKLVQTADLLAEYDLIAQKYKQAAMAHDHSALPKLEAQMKFLDKRLAKLGAES